ncbi:general transcription factor 3C polypeptide 2 isoform X2 [Melanotaenia boesemani]|uniref:general transcription factor 3C polypeptide 2 isoform X2 n=1 Tax=Melanotaenia boesemani TaxID=1250792 RepID=UPI001C056BBA|nr:general transcription factor 3C polypeptide 2 isoform X2 [Melanotaenia boesemani]
MDPTDSEEGVEKPSEQLSPSSKGRQRKKNSKYLDYETDDMGVTESATNKTPRKNSSSEGENSQKSPAKTTKSKTAKQPTTEGDGESTDEPASDQTVAKWSKNQGRPRKSVSKETSKTAVTTGGDDPLGEAGEAVVLNSVQQENGTLKPKRKYVKKQRVQEDPPHEKDPGKPSTEPEENVGPGGRRRRGAAKMALKSSEQCLQLSPSSKGRQRKKNSKYLDYETDDMGVTESVTKKTPTKNLSSEGADSQKSPAKTRTSKTAKQPTTSGDEESADEPASESVCQTVAKRSKKLGRPRKTASKETSKTAVTTDGNGPLGAGEAVVLNSVQQENGTSKPKRKYVKKQRVQEDPPHEKDPGKPSTEPEENVGPGGRRQRGAAKMALKYFHLLAKVESHPTEDEPSSPPHANSKDHVSEQGRGKRSKGRKRKRLDSDAAEDEDFVPDIEEEADEMEEEEEEYEEDISDADSDIVEYGRRPKAFHVSRTYTCSNGRGLNGLSHSIINAHWESAETTRKFREEHHSSWVFPDWIPSANDWEPVPQSDLEEYLPQERRSATFKVSRENFTEESPKQTLSRFEAVPAHPDRWDMFLFAGGPLWTLEWCPTPDGAPATQYIALACHRQMDDLHHVNQTCTGPGLVQLWDCGKLEYNNRPDAQPALVYGLAQDKGVIWHLKWCPAGSWELPSCVRKAPFLPRLGLLAVATSNSMVTIYSMPHPDALLSNKKIATSAKDNITPPVYKVRGVVTLKLGSIGTPHHEKSGMVLSMDWLPQKPHNIMAIGFYDGIVGLWDLSTKSSLLRVREPGRSLSLLPYRCIPAHNHAVRALSFCPASRYLLTTAGEDRCVKTWDLRRLCDPLTVQKRSLVTELYWPLNAPGLLITEDCSFVARGSQGVHYFDHYMRSYFPILRSTSVWSMSYSEWLHSVLSTDDLGEVIFAILPHLHYNFSQLKRVTMRRYPVCLTTMVPCDTTEEKNERMGGVEDAGDVDGGEEGGSPDATPEGGRIRDEKGAHLQFQTYKEAVKKYYLHYTDGNMRNLVKIEKRAVWKRMKSTDGNTKNSMDDMSLAAIHKVRFNPNMSSHVWLAFGGQTGLVRLHCLRTLISPNINKMIDESQAHFNDLYSLKDQTEAVQTATEEL